MKKPIQFSFTNFVIFKNSKVYNCNYFISAKSVYSLELNDVEATNDILQEKYSGSFMIWDCVGTASITNSQFRSIHSSYLLTSENYLQNLFITSSHFYDLNSIDIHCSLSYDPSPSNIYVSDSTFDELKGVRGSFSVRMCTNLNLNNSIFRNSSSYVGGALLISSIDQLTMQNLEFLSNKAIYREKTVFQTFGSGGAIYLHSIKTINGRNITFTNNTALKGGAMYISHNTINSYNFTIDCFDNIADFSGGCYYLGSSTIGYDSPTTKLITIGANKNNKAFAYGNLSSSSIDSLDFSYCTVTNIDRSDKNSYQYGTCVKEISFSNISRKDIITITLFPGQIINMTMRYFDNFNVPIPLTKSTNVFSNQAHPYYPNIDFKYKQSLYDTHSNVVPYFSVSIKTKSLVETNNLNNRTEYLYFLESDNVQFNLSIVLADCPYLMEMRYDGSGLYICKDKIRYDIIIPCSIIGGIFILITGIMLGFFFIYIVVLINNRIVKRLKKLHSIEKAESALERNIIEKTFDYNQEDNEYSAYYNNSRFSINNIFTSNKKQKIYGKYKSDSKTIPFIDEEEEELSSHESKTMYYSTIQDYQQDNYLQIEQPTKSKKSGMFIPIENLNIISKIGQGASGIVYKCLLKPNTMVAIKTLSTESVDEEEAEKLNEEFETEVGLMKSLRHPNIVNFYGVSLSNNTKYMVIEFMENGSLENIIYKSRIGKITLQLEDKLKIILDVSKGVNYLHSLNPCIIHRYV